MAGLEQADSVGALRQPPGGHRPPLRPGGGGAQPDLPGGQHALPPQHCLDTSRPAHPLIQVHICPRRSWH